MSFWTPCKSVRSCLICRESVEKLAVNAYFCTTALISAENGSRVSGSQGRRPFRTLRGFHSPGEIPSLRVLITPPKICVYSQFLYTLPTDQTTPNSCLLIKMQTFPISGQLSFLKVMSVRSCHSKNTCRMNM